MRFLALVLLVVSVGNAQDSSARREVYSLLQRQQFAEAEAMVQPLVEKAPGDCSLLAMLGIAQRGEGKTMQAYATFHGAVKACPRALPILEGAAEIAYAERKPEAKELLKEILAVRPDDPTSHAMLGAIEARTGDCPAAVDDYKASGAGIAQNVPALRQYAGCLMIVDDKSEALRVLTQVVSLQDAPENRMMLARMQNASGARADALATLQPLIAASAPDDGALLLAAQIAEAQNNTPQAVAWVRQAIQTAPKNDVNYVYFAEISFVHGSSQVGIDMLNVGLQEMPGNARLLLARGVLEVQITKLDAALADFEEAHRVDPKLSFVDDAMGVLFSQKNDNADALALFAKKVKERPDDPLMQYLYAEALSEGTADNAELTQRAIGAAKRAIQLEPSYVPARDLLCVLLLRSGDLEGVVAQAEEATKRDPYDEGALYQELLAQRKLKHAELTRELVSRLEGAKRHNQVAVTKYILKDDTQ